MEEAKNTKECFVSFSCQPRTNEIDNKNNIVFIIDSDLDKKEIEEKAEGIKEDFDGSSNSPIINSFENKKENINKAPIDNFYNVVRRFRYISIYETKCRYYIIGTNKGESIYRVLKLDREGTDSIDIDLDPTEYDPNHIKVLLFMLQEANKKDGMRLIVKGYGILGFIRFIHGYYMIIITKKTKQGSIGPHQVYSVSKIAYYYIPKKLPNDQDSRYRTLFFNLEFSDFYFSYTYDLTHTLQHNLTYFGTPYYDKRFVWNHYLMKPLLKKEGINSPWVLPLIHGYYAQKTLSQHGRLFTLSIIARRSRYFAGTRYLKRGVNSQGQVANDVETEQIAEDTSVSVLQSEGRFTSFVQIRGSIPLFWGQEPKSLTPKPPIYVLRCDPLYAATKLHIKDLYRRFGSPIVILNLVKQKEKKPRESVLSQELCIAFGQINESLPDEFKIKYVAWDFSHASKSESENIITQMSEIAEDSINETNFFHSGKKKSSRNIQSRHHIVEQGYGENGWVKLQTGVLRSNCIDSLDRTNAAQYVAGKVAMGYQLYAMGITQSLHLDFDDEACEALMDLYQGMGNNLAIQYGGSELAHTMKSYNSTGSRSLKNTPRDMFTSVRRYYSNFMIDNEKQDRINLFLGNYRPWQETTDLWDLETDYYLHMKDPSYSDKQMLCGKWWEESLEQYNTDKILRKPYRPFRERGEDVFLGDLYYEEAYSPFRFTSFDKKLEKNYVKPVQLTEFKGPLTKEPTVYYGVHKKKNLFVFNPGKDSTPNSSSSNLQNYSSWDPISEAHPQFHLAIRQRYLLQTINGPEHNALSRYNLQLNVAPKNIDIYHCYLTSYQNQKVSNLEFFKKRKFSNQSSQSKIEDVKNSSTSYISFDGKPGTPKALRSNSAQINPTRKDFATAPINVSSPGTFTDSIKDYHLPSPIFASATYKSSSQTSRQNKPPQFAKAKTLYSDSRDSFYCKVIDNASDISIICENNGTYKSKFDYYKKKQASLNVSVSTPFNATVDLNPYIKFCQLVES